MNHYYSIRREKLYKKMDDNTLLVVFAGNPIKRSADAHYLFEVNKNFFYLTGIDEPNAILFCLKQNQQIKEMLFVRDIDPLMEKWNGKYITKEEATRESGIEIVYDLSNFQSFLERVITRNQIAKIYFDSERVRNEDISSSGETFANEVSKKWLLAVENIYREIAALRTIKDEYELDQIRKAIDLTNQAFLHMLKQTKPLKKEYELQAEFEYVLNSNNAKPAFDMIVASSKRACVLHYVTNQETIEEETLILTDMGACLNYYNSDITRTFPSTGRFTSRQKELMMVVLEAMNLVFEACKPNVTLAHLNQIVIKHYQKRLKELNVITKPEEVSEYYYHGVSHFLGLDVHDVGQMENMLLQPGHVITVEPGLYIEKENIGIRIEDDILITETGYENLSKHIIKTPEDIEQYMK
jgi:Xaa-Pro aminopeptidase